MKTFEYTIGGKRLSLRLDDRSGTIAELTVDGLHPQPEGEEEMARYAAVISLALITYQVEEVHDDETGVITIAPSQQSSWSTPSDLMNHIDAVR